MGASLAPALSERPARWVGRRQTGDGLLEVEPAPPCPLQTLSQRSHNASRTSMSVAAASARSTVTHITYR